MSVIARRIVFVTFLTLEAAACAWVPWRAPTPESQLDDEFDLRPSPQGGYVRLGYGWAWEGPRAMRGAAPPPQPALQSTLDTLARKRACDVARQAGCTKPPDGEIALAVQRERTQWMRRMNAPRAYYRSHATPDHGRILIAIASTAALAAVLYGLLSGEKIIYITATRA